MQVRFEIELAPMLSVVRYHRENFSSVPSFLVVLAIPTLASTTRNDDAHRRLMTAAATARNGGAR